MKKLKKIFSLVGAPLGIAAIATLASCTTQEEKNSQQDNLKKEFQYSESVKNNELVTQILTVPSQYMDRLKTAEDENENQETAQPEVNWTSTFTQLSEQLKSFKSVVAPTEFSEEKIKEYQKQFAEYASALIKISTDAKLKEKADSMVEQSGNFSEAIIALAPLVSQEQLNEENLAKLKEKVSQFSNYFLYKDQVYQLKVPESFKLFDKYAKSLVVYNQENYQETEESKKVKDAFIAALTALNIVKEEAQPILQPVKGSAPYLDILDQFFAKVPVNPAEEAKFSEDKKQQLTWNIFTKVYQVSESVDESGNTHAKVEFKTIPVSYSAPVVSREGLTQDEITLLNQILDLRTQVINEFYTFFFDRTTNVGSYVFKLAIRDKEKSATTKYLMNNVSQLLFTIDKVLDEKLFAENILDILDGPHMDIKDQNTIFDILNKTVQRNITTINSKIPLSFGFGLKFLKWYAEQIL